MFDYCLMLRLSRDESFGDSDFDVIECFWKYRWKDILKKVCVFVYCFEILRVVYMESGIFFFVSFVSFM